MSSPHANGVEGYNMYYSSTNNDNNVVVDKVVARATDIFFVLVFATLWAWLEVEIEGKYGWAQNLPTACAFMGWTWYHVCMNIIVLYVLYVGLRCVQFEECMWKRVSFFALYSVAWFVTEDVLWFVLNPSYGIARYNVEDIPWHASKPWFAGTFIYNWIVILVWSVAASVQYKYTNHVWIFRDMCIAVVYVLTLVLISLVRPGDYTSPVVSNTGCYEK